MCFFPSAMSLSSLFSEREQGTWLPSEPQGCFSRAGSPVATAPPPPASHPISQGSFSFPLGTRSRRSAQRLCVPVCWFSAPAPPTAFLRLAPRGAGTGGHVQGAGISQMVVNQELSLHEGESPFGTIPSHRHQERQPERGLCRAFCGLVTLLPSWAPSSKKEV